MAGGPIGYHKVTLVPQGTAELIQYSRLSWRAEHSLDDVALVREAHVSLENQLCPSPGPINALRKSGDACYTAN